MFKMFLLLLFISSQISVFENLHNLEDSVLYHYTHTQQLLSTARYTPSE